MFEVVLSPEAKAFFAAADKPLARKLSRCFLQLEREPHGAFGGCLCIWRGEVWLD
jgi:hypothetical protein